MPKEIDGQTKTQIFNISNLEACMYQRYPHGPSPTICLYLPTLMPRR